MPTLLIVEDNELNRDMLSRRLRRRGYEVALAGDGAEAVRVAAETGPDLILMDMSLPVLDGWEATRRIKAAPATRAIPVIALTAHAMAGDEARAREAGCDDFDTKPVDLPRLLGKIERWLGGPAGATAPSAQAATLTCDGRMEALVPILEFIDAQCAAARVPADAAFGVRLAVEEVCTNIIRHGYAGRGAGPIVVAFRREPGAVAVTITDEAPVFDPAAARQPNLDADWDQRPLGGLGWHLVREVTDEVEHAERPGGGNVVTLRKRIPQDTDATLHRGDSWT